MKKRRLSYVLAHSDIEKLEMEVKRLEKEHSVSLLKAPELGLAMVKVRDGVYRESFYIGEVLITECSVHLDGVLGMGIVQGEDERRAYCMGVIDAAFNSDKVCKKELITKIEEWEINIKDSHIEENAMVEGSKVKFNTMGE
ncbi:MAG: phosphonate C-P lyase system protein PhnG [Cetobacterium sp.]